MEKENHIFIMVIYSSKENIHMEKYGMGKDIL